jgi:FKBP-type peptidyl-prolyl cis-trans isomerase SlyD
MEPRVAQDKVVRIAYKMKTFLRDGTVKEGKPEEIEFIYGVNRQVPSLEKALEGAAVGDKIKVEVKPEEIYGEYDPQLVREIPKKGLIKQRIQKDTYYRQMKYGSLISFKVLEIKPETIVADFNKPMAGISVLLEAEVIGLRSASPQEINAAMESEIKKSIGCG